MHINDFGLGAGGRNSAFREQPKLCLNNINNSNNTTEKVGACGKCW